MKLPIVYISGSLGFWECGQLHREGGLPAYIWATGALVFYERGQLHREGGLPAWIWDDGTLGFYERGERIQPNMKGRT